MDLTKFHQLGAKRSVNSCRDWYLPWPISCHHILVSSHSANAHKSVTHFFFSFSFCRLKNETLAHHPKAETEDRGGRQLLDMNQHPDREPSVYFTLLSFPNCAGFPRALRANYTGFLGSPGPTVQGSHGLYTGFLRSPGPFVQGSHGLWGSIIQGSYGLQGQLYRVPMVFDGQLYRVPMVSRANCMGFPQALRVNHTGFL